MVLSNRLIALAVSAALICGCAKENSEEAIAGVWAGDPPVPAEFKNDESFQQLAKALKGSIEMELNSDHTYVIRTWARKTGKWKLLNNLIVFSETGSRSPFKGALAESMEFGELDTQGKRTYSAILSKDKATISLLMGRQGEVTFHR